MVDYIKGYLLPGHLARGNLRFQYIYEVNFVNTLQSGIDTKFLKMEFVWWQTP